MTPATEDLEINQGGSFQLLIGFDDEAGALVDLTGYRAQMRIAATAAQVYVDASSENGMIALARVSLDGEDYNLGIGLPPAQTAKILSSCRYELWLFQADTFAAPVLEGRVRLNRSLLA